MLRKTGERWDFESELALENFVSENLESLFGFTLLKRQYHSNGEICDILALNQDRRLVVIELKNCEDRYVVQQLTRYYDSLLNEKPFQSQVNYDHPAHLIAIAPSFHRHNLVDRAYNKLQFQFLRFEVLHHEQKFHLLLKDIDTAADSKIEIPYQEVVGFDFGSDIPAPPKVLLEYLGAYSLDKQQTILKLRHSILSFDKRMQETVTAKSIQYGRGKTKLCAELCFDKKQCELALFLWLPLWRHRPNLKIGRHRIWTDWTKVLHFAHVPDGLGEKKKPQEYWNSIPRKDWPLKVSSMNDFIADPFNENIAASIGCKDTSGFLEPVLDVALEKWHARL